jgi:hypothetical protein
VNAAKEPAWLGIALGIGVGFVVGTVFLRGTSSSRNQDSDDFVRVAMISMHRDAHVKELLAAGRIPVATWGGGKTGYWVQVPASQIDRAMTVLRKDAKDHHYYIHFGDQHPISLLEKKWIEAWVDAPYADLLSRSQYSPSTDVGACLRHPEVASVANTYPKISRIRYLKHKLFEASAKTVVVEELWMEMFPESDGGKRRLSGFQVFDGGREVHCITDRERSSD